MSGKFVFVSGLSGAGKTTLGEKLKSDDNFVHFNVDVWAFGGDPVQESNMVPNPEMMAKRDPAIKDLFDAMIAGGFKRLAAGEAVEWSSWEGFFKRLAPDVLAAREAHAGRDFVVSFSVYLRSVRDLVRELLGNDLVFVVLNPSIEQVAQRKVAHLRNTAEARGLTLSAFLRSFNPSSDAPELPEDVIVSMLTQQAATGANGFEGAQSDEPRTLGLGDTSVDEAVIAVREFLQSA